MRVQMAIGALGSLLMLAGPTLAQTEAIQKQIEKKLGEKRKEQAGLDELFAQALKNNPDIRVAEAKLREAEAELYRVRVNVLNRIVMLRQEIRGARASAEEAQSRYQREKDLAARGGSSAPELSAARAAAEKFKADLAVKEAELDMFLGKHHGKIAEQMSARAVQQTGPPDVFKPAEALLTSTALSPELVQKVRKALDAPFKDGVGGKIAPHELLGLLRAQTKGINVLGKIEDTTEVQRPMMRDPVPLGALYQWAEDQLGWRFVVRDYGIVAVGHESLIPPGAVLLRTLWPAAVKPRDTKAK